MRVVYDAEALAEAADAVAWYDERSPGLGERFLGTLERTVARILLMPAAHPIKAQRGTRTVRCALMGEFPYGVFYEALADEIRVLAVGHLKRRPGYWKSRPVTGR